MIQKLDVFEFVSYEIQPDKKTINFNYRTRDLYLTEKIILPSPIPSSVNSVLLKNILDNLHLILGISYFKIYCPKEIVIPYYLSKAQADFWNTVYTKGLGEFFYRNKIDFRGLINFPSLTGSQATVSKKISTPRFLVAIGGGKDSIVSVEMLKEQKKEFSGYILETQADLPL